MRFALIASEELNQFVDKIMPSNDDQDTLILLSLVITMTSLHSEPLYNNVYRCVHGGKQSRTTY